MDQFQFPPSQLLISGGRLFPFLLARLEGGGVLPRSGATNDNGQRMCLLQYRPLCPFLAT